MTDNDQIENILNHFLNNASQEEIEEFRTLLKQKKKVDHINVEQIAKQMATGIQEQMGITTENLKKTAKDLVVNLARKHKPDISNSELKVLVNHMVPGEKKQKMLPPDLLLSMIDQFICYSIGQMPENELAQLPENWTQRYWESFPTIIQKLISAYLNEQINIDEFWSTVKEVLKK